MTTTDRELLEYAAKAAGLEESGWMADTYTHVVNDQFVFWNPLTDDGDAFRLMVGLNLMVDYIKHGYKDGHVVAVCNEVSAYELREPDTEAATRRAIVRAAAEIGRRMESDEKEQ